MESTEILLTGTAALIGSIIGGVTGVQGAGSLAVLLRLLQQNTGVGNCKWKCRIKSVNRK